MIGYFVRTAIGALDIDDEVALFFLIAHPLNDAAPLDVATVEAVGKSDQPSRPDVDSFRSNLDHRNQH